jgi:peptidyl-prolyl cis-trans isomerase C
MLFVKSRLLLTSAVIALTLSACGAKDNAAAPVAKEDTVATVNGTPISKARIEMIVKQSGDPKADTPEARKIIVDQMVMQMLIAEEAIKKGLDKTPEVMDQLEVLKLSILSNAYVQDYLKTHQVSDAALKAEYDRIKAGLSGNEYKARHILVTSDADAKSIIAKLKKNPDAFEKLAMANSIDTGSKDKGGDLGWFDISRMVPEFGSAVAKLEKGKITEQPVKTQFGYHIIMLDDSRPIAAPPFEEVKPQLTKSLQQAELKKQIDGLKTKAKIDMVGESAPAMPAAPETK